MPIETRLPNKVPTTGGKVPDPPKPVTPTRMGPLGSYHVTTIDSIPYKNEDVSPFHYPLSTCLDWVDRLTGRLPID